VISEAASKAADIIAHYLDVARSGVCVDNSDRQGELESEIQAVIDEAVQRAIREMLNGPKRGS
jgi:hypothetical protein